MTNKASKLKPDPIGYLGLRYPQDSRVYEESGNLGNSASGSSADQAVRGRRVPIIGDPNTHYSIPVFHTSEPITNSFGRGLNEGGGAALWSTNLSALTDTIFTRAFSAYQSPLDNALYIVGVNISNYPTILKFNVLSGGYDVIFLATDTVFSGAIDNPGHVRPRDMANPDTCIWDGIYGNNSGTMHTTMDCTAQTATKELISVDGQVIETFAQYITADHEVIMGGYCSGITPEGNRVIQFSISRGAVKNWVTMKYDGNLPLVAHSRDDLKIITPQTYYNSGIIQLGDSVHFHSNDLLSEHSYVLGKRTFDRADFDRWLTDICDAMKMPIVGAYY